MSDNPESEGQQRDGQTLVVLGIFFAVMGVLVLIGTFGAVGKTSAVVVSVSSGLVLLFIGLGMSWFGRRLSRSHN